MTDPIIICACFDSGCRERHGRKGCRATGDVPLARTDMDDEGEWYCEGCAEDALNSGVFRVVEAHYTDCATATGMYDN